jgi:hypothetical protein
MIQLCDQARQAILEELARCGCGRVLTDRELEQLGIFFPDRRYGEIVFLLEPGWMLSTSNFNGPGWRPQGMHGYHPSDRYSDAIFLSNWMPRQEPQSIMDVYRCLEEAALGE